MPSTKQKEPADARHGLYSAIWVTLVTENDLGRKESFRNQMLILQNSSPVCRESAINKLS